MTPPARASVAMQSTFAALTYRDCGPSLVFYILIMRGLQTKWACWQACPNRAPEHDRL